MQISPRQHATSSAAALFSAVTDTALNRDIQFALDILGFPMEPTKGPFCYELKSSLSGWSGLYSTHIQRIPRDQIWVLIDHLRSSGRNIPSPRWRFTRDRTAKIASRTKPRPAFGSLVATRVVTPCKTARGVPPTIVTKSRPLHARGTHREYLLPHFEHVRRHGDEG